MLEHLDGEHEVERVVGERQVWWRHRTRTTGRGLPVVGEFVVGQVEAEHAGRGEPFDHPSGDDALTDADLEDSSWCAGGAAASSIESNAAKNPRIMRCSIGFVEAYLSYVLPVGVAGHRLGVVTIAPVSHAISYIRCQAPGVRTLHPVPGTRCT